MILGGKSRKLAAAPHGRAPRGKQRICYNSKARVFRSRLEPSTDSKRQIGYGDSVMLRASARSIGQDAKRALRQSRLACSVVRPASFAAPDSAPPQHEEEFVLTPYTRIAQIVSIALASAALAPAMADDSYPSRPVRYILPYPPGGSTDPMARFICAKLSEIWKESCIVDNRPGGNTVIGTQTLVNASPDGYNIGWAGASMFSTPTLLPSLPYDVTKDLTGIATIAKQRVVLVVHPSVPANSVQELIALAKAKPGALNFASSGHGTNTHLSGELFKLETGVNITHVPYKGSGPATQDLLAGRVQMSFQIPITVIPMIAQGKLKALALTGDERLEALSKVPTFAEAGLPGYGLTGVTGMVAPAKTPRKILEKINDDIETILRSPSTKATFDKQGVEPYITTSPDDMTRVLKEQIERYGKIIKAAGIQFQP
jgi:tripartite-type tricarboxylate transporter receptor subunit TctC